MNILALLQSRAKELSIQPQKVLQHYAMERFLYRLSRSPYRERFFLKGGMLLMGMGATPARTTMDIDLLGRISNDHGKIKEVFRQILSTKPGVQDGVSFSTKLETSDIAKDAEYVGVRVSFTANVAGEPVNMKVDIGFGDELYPEPQALLYPPTINELPGADLLCYTRESVVAEKWQTMVRLKQINTRMKDFYDLWFLSRSYDFSMKLLQEAIFRTFQRRDTPTEQYKELFAESFYAEQQSNWTPFVNKLKADNYRRKPPLELPPRYFGDLMEELSQWLSPVMENAPFTTWMRKSGWK